MKNPAISACLPTTVSPSLSAPHTEEVTRAYNDYLDKIGADRGRAAVLDARLKQLQKANPKLSDEVNNAGLYAAENGQLPANLSPEAKEWIGKANNGLLREFGDRMR